MARLLTSTARKAALGMAAAAAMMTSASAADFTQAECKGIAGTATEVVKSVGAKTLSREFRQSFMNWMGSDLRCDGPKDIIVITHNDDAALATIRDALLTGSKPLDLSKVLRIVIKAGEKVSEAAPVLKRSEATPPAPTVN